jgi:hypothetical protein
MTGTPVYIERLMEGQSRTARKLQARVALLPVLPRCPSPRKDRLTPSCAIERNSGAPSSSQIVLFEPRLTRVRKAV